MSKTNIDMNEKNSLVSGVLGEIINVFIYFYFLFARANYWEISHINKGNHNIHPVVPALSPFLNGKFNSP